MAIPIDSLNKNFIVLTADATLAEVRDRVKATRSNWTYVVVQLSEDEFAVFRIGELIKLLQESQRDAGPSLLNSPLTHLLETPCPFVARPLDHDSVGRAEAQRLVKASTRKRLAVVSGKQVIGVLAIEARSAEATPDFEWLDEVSNAPGTLLGSSASPVTRSSMKAMSSELEVPAGTGGSEVPDPPPASGGVGETGDHDRVSTTPALLSEDPPQPRWINAEILDHALTAPLAVGEVYTLAFDVDTQQRASSLARDAAFTYKFSPNEETVDLTVQLSSSDFTIHTEPQKLRVPRTGRSKGRARFDIEPTHKGEGSINAVFLKDGNFIQLLTLKLNVGGPQKLKAESLSRPLEAAFDVQPRDLGLVITNTGTAFKLILTGSVYAEAMLPLTIPELDQLIAEARTALRQVVNFEEGPSRKKVYQQGIAISDGVNRAALKHLAQTGFLLFQKMFYGDAADAQAQLLGDRLIAIAQQQRLKIQIVSQQFLLPWGILYLADELDPDNVDAERFLGLKHIIEHIPLQPSMQVVDAVIKSQPNLTVSLNVNDDIDREMGLPLIADQLNYWQRISDRGGAKVIVRKSGQEVEKALADPSSSEQIFYFYCHAVSRSLADGGGPDASSLQFAGGGLTLRDLKLRAPAKKLLAGAPLVFINACESAELSPLFYGGFVPYFMAKGARGVIGTECETPALFAREWARCFFDSFLAGESLGQVVLDLRRQFFYQHNNVMGLLYAVYCDGDTRVVPGVELSQV